MNYFMICLEHILFAFKIHLGLGEKMVLKSRQDNMIVREEV